MTSLPPLHVRSRRIGHILHIMGGGRRERLHGIHGSPETHTQDVGGYLNRPHGALRPRQDRQQAAWK